MSATPGAIVIGATSGMGRAIARRLASEGYALILAGRDFEALSMLAADLVVRFDTLVEPRSFEALAFESHAEFMDDCIEHFAGGLQGLVLCHGQMPEQHDAAHDFALARRMIEVNYLSNVSLLNLAADHLQSQGRGFIAAITSVAGDRGRESNYLYGSSKAALSAMLSGMRVRLAKNGVAVVDVRPGFIDTQLTWGRSGMFLVGTPETVARDLLRGVKRNRAVVYTPFFWRGIMLIIRWIPDVVFRRLSL